MIQILQLSSQKEIRNIFQQIGVDPCGIKIMLPKAVSYLTRMHSVSNTAANILKQEMLSLGGDVAVARSALTGKSKKTDCLIMGTLFQFNQLSRKLNRQPFGLDKLSEDLSCMLNRYQRNDFIINLGRLKLDLRKRAHIMGILNLTPDSFSQDGLYDTRYAIPACRTGRRDTRYITDFVERMVHDGADIIDVGGESSRPGAKPVPVKEELKRTIPVVKALSKKIKVPISIDTHKPQVAKQALDNGAVIVNDITGLRNPEMATVVSRYKAGVVIMHMQGNPRTMQKNPRYNFLINEIIEYLKNAIDKAKEFGIDSEKIIIDPGIGFGKTVRHNLEILKHLAEFKVLGRPILLGTSRKSFIGKILNAKEQERIFGTVSSCIWAVKNGAKILRIHDVKEVKQALKIFEAINKGVATQK
jgi:dihydropteroate synthase